MSKKKTGFKPHREVKYETYSSERMKYGKNKFIEVARKVAITTRGQTEFIIISKGYFHHETVKYEDGFTFPDDVEFIEFLIGQLEKCKDRNKY